MILHHPLTGKSTKHLNKTKVIPHISKYQQYKDSLKWKIVVSFEDANWFFFLYVYIICLCVCVCVFMSNLKSLSLWLSVNDIHCSQSKGAEEGVVPWLCGSTFYTVHPLYSIYNHMLFTQIHEEKHTETRLKPRADGPYMGLKHDVLM